MVRYCWSATVLVVLFGCRQQPQANATSQATAQQSALPGQAQSYRAMVYTDKFQQRFSLPSAGVQPLDPGLHAVVIRVVERPGEHPGCFLDLYLDDSLDLAFPEGSEGVISYPDDVNPFFFVRGAGSLGVEDHRWDAMLGSFHTKACSSGAKACVEEVGAPHAYFRQLVTGVALHTYRLMCDMFDPRLGATEMWMLRSGQDRAALDAQSTNEAATYRFAMPAALFEHAAPRIRQAIQYYANTPVGPEPPRGRFSIPARR